MKNVIKFLSVSVLMPLLFISCNSDDNGDSNNDGSPPQNGFFYAENGETNLTKADNAWVNGDYNSIIAQNGGNTVVEIVLANLAEGTYDLSVPYAFTYVKGGLWEASAGTLTITKNAGGKLSGTFDATDGSGVSGVNSVKGKFDNIPIN